MLHVRTFVARSQIPNAGQGLFAAEKILKGTLIWKFNPDLDRRFTPEQVASFPTHLQEFLKFYGSRDPRTGRTALCLDDARFYNHSDDPNTSGYDETHTEGSECNYALRDIQAGEELTVNYKEFDDDPTYGFTVS